MQQPAFPQHLTESAKRKADSVQHMVMPRPDCCAEWTRSAYRLKITVARIDGMHNEPDPSIQFCPWCGRARHNVPELRRWAFEKAMALKADLDIVADLIYKAAEIEAYITEGKNPRGDFFSCVDTALAEVDHASIPEVSNASKRKMMVVVRKWLKEYDALD